MLGRLGIDRVITRDVARDKTMALRFLSSAIVLSIFIALLLIGGLPWLARLLQYDKVTQYLIGIVSIAAAGHAIARPAEAVLQALEQMTVLSVIRILIEVSTTVAALIVMVRGYQVPALIWVLVVGVWVEAVILLSVVFYHTKFIRWKPDGTTLIWLVREGFPLFILISTELVISRFDILLLARLRGTGSVGLYTPGVNMIRVTTMVRQSAMTALFPFLSVQWKQTPRAFAQIYSHIIRLFSIYGIGIAVGFTFLAGPLIQLIFGDAYAASAGALRVLAWAMALDALSGPMIATIIITRERLMCYIPVAVGTAAFNITANLLLIPRFSFMGAAWATLGTALLTLLVRTWWLRGVFGLRPGELLQTGWKPAMAGLVMALTFWGLPSVNIWFVATLSVVVYTLMLFILGAVELDEVRRVRESLMYKGQSQ
jgi:O-antigen/teichoic acid export membrane protein